jgi:hypothetical protein
MVAAYCGKLCALMAMIFTLILMSNVVGYGVSPAQTIPGLLILCGIAVVGLTISKAMSRFVKLPSMMYVVVLAVLLSCPISPVSESVIALTSNVQFMAPTTAMGAFIGISLGKEIKAFAKMGWKYVIITIFVITGTFVFSALIADLVLKVTGVI